MDDDAEIVDESENPSDEEGRQFTEAPSPRSGGARNITPPDQEPDVLLDVPTLHVDEIDLDVENLRARVNLQAEVLDLVRLNVGADVALDRVKLDVQGVDAQAVLKVRLDHVAAILQSVLATIDHNPQIIEPLTSAAGSTVRDIGGGARQAVGEVGEGAGEAAAEVGKGAGRAAEEVGGGAGRAAEEVGEGAGRAAEGVGGGAGRAAEEAGEGAGKAADEAGEAAGETARGADTSEFAGTGAGAVVRRTRRSDTEAPGDAGKGVPRKKPETADAGTRGPKKRTDRKTTRGATQDQAGKTVSRSRNTNDATAGPDRRIAERRRSQARARHGKPP